MRHSILCRFKTNYSVSEFPKLTPRKNQAAARTRFSWHHALSLIHAHRHYVLCRFDFFWGVGSRKKKWQHHSFSYITHHSLGLRNIRGSYSLAFWAGPTGIFAISALGSLLEIVDGQSLGQARTDDNENRMNSWLG